VFDHLHPNELEDLIQAQPLIDELDVRISALVEAQDQCVEMDLNGSGGVLSFTLMVRPTTVIKWHNDQLLVAWDGRKALNRVFGQRVWLIDIYPLTRALDEVRRYMVLDDLSSI